MGFLSRPASHGLSTGRAEDHAEIERLRDEVERLQAKLDEARSARGELRDVISSLITRKTIS